MHHNILQQKRSSNTKIHFVISDCSQEMLITMPPQALAMIAMLWLLKIRKVFCTPCCHGWPRASRSRLSRFPQIIVGSSLSSADPLLYCTKSTLSSADPHWPDFLPFPAVTLLWRLLQPRLQKTDGDEEIIICRNADGKVQLFLLDQSDIFEQALKSKMLAEGHLSVAPMIWLLGCLRVSLKSGPDDNTCF